MTDDIRKEVSEEKRAEYLHRAQRLADECRSVIQSEVDGGHLKTDVKHELDLESLVTSADKKAESAFRDRVRGLFPDAGIIGEEFFKSNPNPHADFQWIIDPIDGTTEFVHEIPVYGTIIALHYKKKPLVGLIDHSALDVRCCGAFGLGATVGDTRIALRDFAPKADGSERIAISAPSNFLRYSETNEFFIRIANKFPNLRILHGCYAQTCTIAGSYDAMIEWNIREWDVAAAEVLIEEAGGEYRCLRQSNREDGTVYCAVFGKPRVVSSIFRLFSECHDREDF